ncbi:S8 family serine peptidase [Streptomyces sp. NPDC054842]
MAPSAVADDVQKRQWYLDAMDADGLWKSATGKGVKVAVLDTGVNPATPSLKGQVLGNAVPKSVSYNATKDFKGHGTTMAELIAGTGAGGGLKGLAPDAKIVPYRVLAVESLDETARKKTPKMSDAIRAAADSDARIISMSFGADVIAPEVEAAVKYAESKGKLMFAAVGNDAEKRNFIGYPAAYPYVVGVAATDEAGRVAKFSEHGDYVDLAAPGLDLPYYCDATLRAYCNDGGGTSAATAIASASAALIWSAHPDWTSHQVLRTLIDTAGRSWPKDKPSNYLGYGLIRPRKVLADKDIDPGPANADPLSYENGTGAAGATPSASVPASSQPPKSTSGGQTSAAGSHSEPSDGNTLWVVLGAVAAAAVIGGGGFAVLRARRNG